MITGVPLHDARHRSTASRGDAVGGVVRPVRAVASRPARRGWIGPVLTNLVAAATYASLTGGPTGAHAVAACVVALASVAIGLALPRGEASASGRDAEAAALRALLVEARDALAPRSETRSSDEARPPA